MWQLFIVFFFIFGTVSQILRRKLAQKFPEQNRLINAIFFIIFLLPTGVILSFFFPHNLDIGLTNLLLLLGGSIIWPILAIVSFRANKEVDVAIFTIISNLSPLFTLLIALPFLNEALLPLQFLGIGLLILSGVVAASAQIGKHRHVGLKGVLLCLLSAAIMGTAIAYESFMLSRVDFGAYLIYGWGSQIAWMTLLTGKDLKKLSKFLNHDKQARKLVLIWGGTRVLQAVSFITALKVSGSAALISAATDFLSVAVIIAAYFYLKERNHMPQKWLGAGLGIAGLLLIAA